MQLLKAKLKNRLLQKRCKKSSLDELARKNLKALENLDPKKHIYSANYVVVDLETTGLDTEKDKVVSVGAVRIEQGNILLSQRFSELVNPGRNMPVQSIKIHGITPRQVAKARPAHLVFQDFLEFLGHDILVAHYAPFDLHFINLTMKRLYGFPLQNVTLDTVLLCRSVISKSDPYGVNRNRKQCTLDSLCQRFNIKLIDRHTAFGDALATAMIFQRFLAQQAKSPQNSLGHLLKMAMVI